MKFSFDQFLEDDPVFSLVNVRYDQIKKNRSMDNDSIIMLRIEDDAEVKSIANDKVEIFFTRKAGFSEDILFSLEVVFSVVYPIKEKSEKFSIEDVQADLELDPDGYLGRLCTDASLLISNITSIGGTVAIVSPPFFQKGE